MNSRVVPVSRIEVDDSGRLLVCTSAETFDQIYRAAMGVNWDSTKRCLVSPVPREWSHVDWYQHIRRAAAQEYGCDLRLGPATVWASVPDEVQLAIEECD